MAYFKLITGLALVVIFVWLLYKNSQRWGFVKALTHIDIILGLAAGFYLTITSAISLLE